MRRPGFQAAVKWRAVGVELPFVFFLALTAHGFWAPSQERLENLDRRRPETPTHEQTDAVPPVQQNVPGARVDFDPILASPTFIASPHGFLTGSNGVGLAVTRQFIDAIPAGDPDRATKAFLNEHAALFGHGAEVLAQAHRKREFVTPHSGLRTVIWEQELGGIPVFQGLLIAHTTQRGELVNISSRLVSDVRKAADAGMPGWLQIQASPPITAEEAVARAAASVGEEMNAAEAKPAGVGSDQRLHYQAPVLLGDTEVRQVWLPVSPNSLRLCWEVVLTSRKRSEMFRLVVDAGTGELLIRHGLTEYYSDATYRVYTSDSPSPYSPSCAAPCTTQPPLVARDLVTLSALASNDSPAGWIGDGQNTTVGNNVDAHLDKNADNVPDPGSRPTGNPFRVFDLSMDLTQQPVTYTNAVVVQLFYWCNWMHDKLYELGFTEAAGNFQTDNFGRGGLGNDAVQADAQDGSGFNNANFSTPSDGSPGRMQMYIFNYPTPNRDGDLDAEVILHEYTHGLSNRRVGGGVGISALQSAGMGEGWSDFYALSLLSQTNDDPNAAYANGGYVTYQLSGLTQNYYFGIRRYPYSTDMTKNPLTFKDIDPAQASAHSGIPRSPIIGTTANEVHNMGEVWCVTLREARANLIAKYGPAVGNQLMLQLVTDGMNLSPANPNFLQARDAILQADQVDTGGANRNQLWAAFAKRGMGASATSPASSTTTGLVEAYDFPDSLKVMPVTGLNSSGGMGGPFSPVSQAYTIGNTGTSALNWMAGKTATWLDISSTSGSLSPGASNTVVITINATANSLSAGAYSDTVTFSNAVSGVTQARAVVLNVHGPTVFLADFEDGNGGYSADGFTYTADPDATSNLWHGTTRRSVSPSHSQYYGLESTGNYNTGARTAGNLLSPSISLVGVTSPIVLSYNYFKQTENSPSWDIATVQVSSNVGATWITLATLADSANFTTVSSDISPYAGQNILIRFNFDTIDSIANTYEGWYIDDVMITGTPAMPHITVTIPTAATEGDGVLTGQGVVYLSSVPTNDVIVALASSDTTEVTVPVSLAIPAGATNATFNVTIVDDAELDGPQLATVTASATGFTSGSAGIIVNDNETATLSLALPTTTIEGTGVVTGTVFASAAPTANVTVTLSSSDTTELVVPATVMLPAGQTSVVFSATVVDDDLIDGPQPATVTAHVAGWTDGNATITVLDNENYNLTVVLPSQVAEADGVITNGGSVSISGTLSSNVVVALTSSDTTELTVPASVTIPAGFTSVTFNLTAIDDGVMDGPQPVTITATTTGFTNGTATLTVLDSDPHHFVFAPISSPQQWGVPFAVTITAMDATNGTVTGFRGPVALSATGSSGIVSMTPTNSVAFTAGQWSGVVTINTLDSNVVLKAAFNGEPTGVPDGLSNPFDIVRPAVQQTSLQTADLVYDPFSGKIYASVTGGSLANTLTAIDPDTVLIGASVQVGSGPGKLAVADNGQYVYVALAGLSTVRRVSIPAMTAGLQFSASVSDMEVMPGNAEALAVCNGGVSGAVVVYDNGVARPATPPYYNQINVIEFGSSASNLYGYNNVTTGFDFTRMLVDSNGVGVVDSGGGLISGFGVDMKFDGGWIFATSGTVINPSNRTVVGTISASGLVRPDVSIGRVFYLNGSTLRAFDPNTFIEVGSITISGVSGSPGSLIRCGADRLAFRTTGGQVFVVRTSLIPTGPPADLQLTQSDSPDPVNVGSNLTYSILITNKGPNAAANVLVSQKLPATVTFVSAVSSQGTCTQSAGTVTGTLGTLGSSADATVTVVVKPTQAGLLQATASVTSSAVDPNGTNNVATTLTSVGFIPSPDSVNILNLTTKDLAYDSVGQRIYASIPSSVGGGLGNSVLALDPASGLASNPVFVGSEPGKLAISDNGQYGYVSLDGAGAVRRVDIPTQTAGLQFSLSGFYVEDMEAMPGNAHAVAISRKNTCCSPRHEGVAVYDDGVQRPNATPGHTGSNVIEFGLTNSVLYGYNNETTEFGFRTMTVDASGVTVSNVVGGLLGSFGLDIKFDGGLIYATSGTVIDPSNRVVVGTYPVSGLVRPDAKVGRVFFLNGSTLWSFEPNTRAQLGSLTIPDISGSASSLIRWGADGLAFRTSGGQIFVIRTSLIASGPPTDLALTQLDSPDPVNAGGNLTYTITASNNGPSGATDACVSDRLPVGVSFVSATASQGTCALSNGLVTCMLGALSSGGTATISIVVTPPSPATLANTAAIYSSAADPNVTNNATTVLTSVQGVASLMVTPVTDLVATGMTGGPFNPSSQTYTLTNNGTAALSWSVTNTASWVSLSATGGSLPPYSATTVTVSINSGANSLPAGSYTDNVTFTNTVNGVGSTTRGVTLTINTPGVLSVTPTNGLISTGWQGGPFTPSSQSYTLSNTGGSPISWAASNSSTWLSLSTSSGTLAPGASIGLTLTIKVSATNLVYGTYSDSVIITNLTNGSGSTTRMATLSVAQASTLASLYSFTGGADGGFPGAGLVQGSDSNFYGTTSGSGSGPSAYGTVFRISSAGSLTTLWSFTNGVDGAYPYAGLAQGGDSNFYGTTSGSGSGPSGYGTVFRISPSGNLTNLHFFSDSDGAYPYAKLVQGSDGNFYGTTSGSGSGPSGNGTVFRISPNGSFTNLWSFTNGVDGANPYDGLVQGSDSNFYGTTLGSGSGPSAYGTVFRISPSGNLTNLHSFSDSDGAYPYAGLVQGGDGNFYGTTSGSGSGPSGNGTVFRITPSGNLTTLWLFTGGSDGAAPYAGLVQGSDGNFYGTTPAGGTNDAGTVYEINAAGVLTTLYRFTGGADGQRPLAGLIQGSDGSFYTTTLKGGIYGYGTVFKLNPWFCTFGINTIASPSDGGSTSGGGTVICGSNVTVCATPNAACYSFVNWTLNGNVVSTSACYTFTANGNYGLVANFTPLAYYTISTSSSPLAGGSTSGGGTVPCGSNVTVCATPNASCYSFVNWTLNGNPVSTSACYTFAAASNETVVANFAPLAYYTISTAGSPLAGGSTSGGGTVPCGSNVTVCATANASCYSFVNWTLNGNPVSTSACYTFAAASNETVVANFALYSISTSSSPAGGGSTSGGGTVPCGSFATVCASANDCYSFVKWTLNSNVVSTSPCYSFTATSNETLVANFTPIPSNTINTSSSPSAGGATSGGGTVPCGTYVSVCAAPNACYSFANWTLNGNVVSTLACYTFAATSNETLVANFAPILSYTINTSSSPSAGGSTSGGGTVPCGSNVTVCASPNASCYSFANWTLNGNAVSTSPCYTFTPAGNETLVANFTPLAYYMINTSSSPAGGGSTSGGGTMPCGSNVAVCATPGSGFLFVDWTDAEGSPVSRLRCFTLVATNNRVLVANFASAPVSTSLYSFTGGADGGLPSAGLVQGSDSNFYGTTSGPGSGPSAYGTVFRISSTGSLTTLWSFTNGVDGAYLYAGLARGSDGNFYGTTSGSGSGPSGYGTVFRINPTGNLTNLYSFSDSDGAFPYAGLVQGSDGNFYGTTSGSGSGPSGYGTVFRISPSGSFTNLWSFTNGVDGAYPYDELVEGGDGNFYGTTSGSGSGPSGNGTVFRITPSGSVTALWLFTGGSDGASPYAGLLEGSDDNFYGTTLGSGSGPSAYGTVFQINSAGALTTLYSFGGGADGQWPVAGLIQGGDGNFYTTTQKGGTYGYGTVSKRGPWFCNFGINTISSPSVGGSTSGGGIVPCGSNATVCASANASCYSFANWTLNGNVVSTSACYTFTANGNYNLVANFTPLTYYTISTSSSPSAGGSTSGGGTVPCGSNVTVCASANPCYSFVNWTLNGNPVSTSACYTFAAASNETVVANFALYSISTSNSPAGGGTTSGGGTVPCGSNLTVCASANPCYSFVNWMLNSNIVSTSACYTLTPASSEILVANFTPILSDTINTSNSPAGGGTTGGGGTVPCGSNVTVCASANPCYSFVNWTLNGSVVSTLACYTFAATSNETVVANFALYSISTSNSPAGGGTISGGGTVPCGSNVTVCASANPCYSFVNWTLNGNIVSISACYTFTVASSETLVANFMPISYGASSSGSLTNLWLFTGGLDGGYPFAGLVQGSDGNFYGTTAHNGPSGNGTVYRITPSGSLTMLWSFSNGSDGAYPYAGLARGSDGNFYGTTSGLGPTNYGTVFRISPGGNLTNLHSFTSSDGAYPYGGLVQGSDGSFYGTTSGSGSGPSSYGTVFQISSAGNLTNLHSFTSSDGAYPYAGLVQGSDGNLYGTTSGSGSGPSGYGTVFRISSAGSLTTLWSFTNGLDGAYPYAGLARGGDGIFYGTTSGSGSGPSSYGTVFRISPAGNLTNLHSFSDSDGAYPFAGLVQGSDGNFYGTTLGSGSGPSAYGTVFRISPAGSLSNLWSFAGCSDGAYPYAGLVQGSDGNFYGTTSGSGSGPSGNGAVFQISVSLKPPANQISAIQVQDANVIFTIPSVASETYQLQYSGDLTSGTWSNVAGVSVTNSIGALLTLTNFGGASRPQGFYRFDITP